MSHDISVEKINFDLTMKPHLQIALALIWRGGEVLIAQRALDADHLPGAMEFPGGKIEPGETPAEAAVREAREETGLEVEVVGARERIEWDYPERRVALYPFDCRIVGGTEAPGCHFVAPTRLKNEDFPAANRSLLVDLQTKLIPL